MEINTSGLYSTIYAGEGNFLTQSEPTNAHTFAPSVYCLTADIAKWREVTAAERTQIEAQDSKWVRPPQEFIDRWNHRGRVPVVGGEFKKVGQFNESTGFFELNGYTDIDYSEALEIDRLYIGRTEATSMLHWFYGQAVRCRTLFPIYTVSWAPLNTHTAFRICTSLQRICFMSVAPAARVGNGVFRYELILSDGGGMFDGCTSLEVIEAKLTFYTKNSPCGNMFQNCKKLREVYVEPQSNISLADSPVLSETSMTYMVSHGTAGITITLHPDAYARVTEEIFAAAAEKNITIAST